MKIFQILDGLCYWDATNRVHTIDEAKFFYSPEILFVEAPDYVFEGWGYDEFAEGDERFIKPEAPEGWAYDDETGTFYIPNFDPPVDVFAITMRPVLDLI